MLSRRRLLPFFFFFYPILVFHQQKQKSEAHIRTQILTFFELNYVRDQLWLCESAASSGFRVLPTAVNDDGCSAGDRLECAEARQRGLLFGNVSDTNLSSDCFIVLFKLIYLYEGKILFSPRLFI